MIEGGVKTGSPELALRMTIEVGRGRRLQRLNDRTERHSVQCAIWGHTVLRLVLVMWPLQTSN